MIYPQRRCEMCPTPIPEREGAGIPRRYCSNACRQSAHRMRFRVAAEYSPTGWPIPPNTSGHPGAYTCTYLTGDLALGGQPVCPALAVWRVEKISMRDHQARVDMRCVDHKPRYAGVPGEVRTLTLREIVG